MQNQKSVKLIGIAFLVITLLIILVASTGATIEERDATAIIFTLPIGLACIFGKGF